MVNGVSQVAQWVKNLPAMQETQMWVPSLGHEDPLEEGMATHSSILAEFVSGDQSIGASSASVLQVDIQH